jgi:hypothetical protein
VFATLDLNLQYMNVRLVDTYRNTWSSFRRVLLTSLFPLLILITRSVDKVNSAGSSLFLRRYFTLVSARNTFLLQFSFGSSRLVRAICDLNSCVPWEKY